MMPPRASLTSVAALAALLATPTFADEPPLEGLVVYTGSSVVDRFTGPERGLVWVSQEFGSANALFVRLHLDVRGLSEDDTPFAFEILNSIGTIVEELTPSQLRSKPQLWTGIVNGTHARLQIRAQSRPRHLRFVVDQVAIGQLPGEELSIIGNDKREEIINVSDPELLRVASAVAKLSFFERGRPASCTGFMISNSLLLTNEHCINSQAGCDDAVALFGYERLPNGSLAQPTNVHCQTLVASSPDADWSLLRLEGRPGEQFGILKLASTSLSIDLPLILVQHPGGRPKQVSRLDCRVSTTSAPGLRPKKTDFGHKCDTLRGSSGSPLLDSTFNVVGVHHLGKDRPGTLFAHENRAIAASEIVSSLPLELIAD